MEAQRLMELKLQQEMKDLEVARLLQEQLDQEQRYVTMEPKNTGSGSWLLVKFGKLER